MQKIESSFLSADGKTPIHVIRWLPDGEPAAVLQLAHGVAEYIARYEPFARWLTERGFAVAGNDHIGHGESLAEGAQPLYFGPRGSWRFAVEDIRTLHTQLAAQFPGLPCCLLGHSMGSFLVRTSLIRHPGMTDAAILMGTGQMSPLKLAGGRLIARTQLRRVGEDRPSPVVEKLAFGAYNKMFAPNRTAFDWLSVNRENVDRYVADPLCGGNASVGLFLEMLGAMDAMSRPENLAKMNRDTPILFVSGASDPVGDCGRGVERAFESFRSAGVRDVSIKLYPAARHEILNDNWRHTVYQDLLDWMTVRLGLKTAAPV